MENTDPCAQKCRIPLRICLVLSVSPTQELIIRPQTLPCLVPCNFFRHQGDPHRPVAELIWLLLPTGFRSLSFVAQQLGSVTQFVQGSRFVGPAAVLGFLATSELDWHQGSPSAICPRSYPSARRPSGHPPPASPGLDFANGRKDMHVL